MGNSAKLSLSGEMQLEQLVVVRTFEDKEARIRRSVAMQFSYIANELRKADNDVEMPVIDLPDKVCMRVFKASSSRSSSSSNLIDSCL